ncbi:MAG: HPr(Ser) kinase/phosphatase [Deltaproteobacteria bacterium]|nr:MAG: HPr(Ser) kinase/phosphatase [Deltaproteobacteria bacterium]
MKKITVSQLLDNEESYDLQLVPLNPEAEYNRSISHYRVQKHGLAFAGFTKYLDRERIQLIGKTETDYLNSLDDARCAEITAKLCQHDIACFIITTGLEPHPILLKQSNTHHIPLLRTQHKTSTFIVRVNRFLEDYLSPTTTVHGVLIDVFGVGTLLIGESGIGKSECALDLIHRGHRLVADDIIHVHHIPPMTLVGSAHLPAHYHMEIRGLGLINIEDIFGVTAIRAQKRIDLVIKMVPWKQYDNRDRLNLEQKTHTLLGVYLPLQILPVSPGRNLVTIIEIAARNHMLTKMGKSPGRELLEQLSKKLEPQLP